LVKEGFRGATSAAPATSDWCGLLPPDSGHLQEEDANFHNRRRSSKHQPALPLYTEQDAQQCMQYFKPVEFDQSVQLTPEFSFRFSRAAHILGSSFAEITAKLNGATRALLFTGDIGRVRESQIPPGRVVHSRPTDPQSPAPLLL